MLASRSIAAPVQAITGVAQGESLDLAPLSQREITGEIDYGHVTQCAAVPLCLPLTPEVPET